MSGIYIGSAQDVRLLNNTLAMDRSRGQIDDRFPAGVLIENSWNVVIDGLKISDKRLLRSGVVIESSVQSGEVEVSNLKCDLPEGVPSLLDLRE